MLNNAIINLVNLKHNAKKIKDKLSSSKLCAVVKADAYGHGASHVANALYNIADSFAVALVEEGIELKQSGINKDILVLIPPFNGEIERAVSYGLTLTVENSRQVALIENACKRCNKKCKAHIKFNSGMNRLGVDSLQQLEKLLDYCSNLRWVEIEGLFSHYACPQDNCAFERATKQFLLANDLVKGYNKNIICHASASGGFLKGAYFDMVRIGIMLYGYLPFESDFNLKPVMKVYSPVVKERKIEKGQNFLYGNQVAESSFSASLIRYGYADGLNRAPVFGQANNRCMDLTMVKDAKAKFYPVMTNALKLAKEYGTIPYEILTKVGIRANKIYIN